MRNSRQGPAALWAGLAFSAFSAAMCGLSLPNELFLYGLWPLGFICLAPFYLAMLNAPSPRRAAASGALFGAMHHGITSYWLFYYKDFAFWTLGMTTIAYSVVYAVLALYLSFLLRSENARIRPYAFAFAWAAFEFLKSTGFLGYPWGLTPYSLTSLPVFLQIADITGVYGLSFFLALSSGLAVEASRTGSLLHAAGIAGNPETGGKRGRARAVLSFMAPHAILWGFIACAILAYGIASLNRNIPVKASIRAVLVQQNTDPWIAGESAALESNVRLARQALDRNAGEGGNPADLIVFSESSLRRPYAEFREWFMAHPADDPLIPLITESGASLLTGAPVILDWDSYAATNSVLLIGNGGELVDSYAKVHPVPFAEAIPLWEFEWFRRFMRETIGIDSGWVMGTRETLFPLRTRSDGEILFSTPICFEDAFADLCRNHIRKGADLFINLTNDSWSKKRSAQIQHWAIARFRAIENRRTLVRSTNSGVSCVVDAWGRPVFEMEQFEAASAVVDIPVFEKSSPTLYTMYGDWFARLALLLAAWRVVLQLARARGSWPRERREQ